MNGTRNSHTEWSQKTLFFWINYFVLVVRILFVPPVSPCCSVSKYLEFPELSVIPWSQLCGAHTSCTPAGRLDPARVLFTSVASCPQVPPDLIFLGSVILRIVFLASFNQSCPCSISLSRARPFQYLITCSSNGEARERFWENAFPEDEGGQRAARGIKFYFLVDPGRSKAFLRAWSRSGYDSWSRVRTRHRSLHEKNCKGTWAPRTIAL